MKAFVAAVVLALLLALMAGGAALMSQPAQGGTSSGVPSEEMGVAQEVPALVSPMTNSGRVIGFALGAVELDGVTYLIFRQADHQENVIYVPLCEFETDDMGKVLVRQLNISGDPAHKRLAMGLRKGPPGLAAKIAEKLREMHIVENIQPGNVLPAEVLRIQVVDVTRYADETLRFKPFCLLNYIGQEMQIEAVIAADKVAQSKQDIEEGGLTVQISMDVPCETVVAQSQVLAELRSLRDIKRVLAILKDATPPGLEENKSAFVGGNEEQEIVQRFRDYLMVRVKVQPGSPGFAELQGYLDQLIKTLFTEKTIGLDDDKLWAQLEASNAFGADLKASKVRDFLKEVKEKVEKNDKSDFASAYAKEKRGSAGFFGIGASSGSKESGSLNISNVHNFLNDKAFKLEKHGEFIIPVAAKVHQMDLASLDRVISANELFEKTSAGVQTCTTQLVSRPQRGWKIDKATIHKYDAALKAEVFSGTGALPAPKGGPDSREVGKQLTRSTPVNVCELPGPDGKPDATLVFVINVTMHDGAGQAIIHQLKFEGLRPGEVGSYDPVVFTLDGNTIVATLGGRQHAAPAKAPAAVVAPPH